MRRQRNLFPIQAFILVATLAWGACNPMLAEDKARPDAQANDGHFVAGRAAIVTALQTPITIQAKDKPFADILAMVERQSHVRILQDNAAIEDGGASPGKPPSLNVTNQPAREVLRSLLQPLDLKYLIRDHHLLVTTHVAADAALETVTYDVTDLVMRQTPGGKWHESNPEAVIDVLTATVRPDTWDTAGGFGSIRAIDLPLGVALVCSQNQEVHAKIEQMLAEWRKREAQRRGSAVLPSPSAEAMLRRTIDSQQSRWGYGESVSTLLPNDNRDSLIRPVNRFAWDLFHQVNGRPDENLFFSPAGVALCLGLLRAGAKEQTGEEISSALHLRVKSAGRVEWVLPESDITPAFACFLDSMHGDRFRDRNDLQVATCFVRPAGQRCLPGFAEAAKQLGLEGSDRELLDRTPPLQEGDTLTDRLPGDLIAKATGGVLRNVVSFRGQWRTLFPALLTESAEFKAGAKRWQVPMMASKEDLKYAEIDGVQMVEKPYLGGAISMGVLLPRDEAGALVELEKRLNATTFDQWLRRLSSVEVRLFLPRFRFERSLDMKPPLIELGLKTAFARGKANFKGIDDTASPPLYIEYFQQSAEIEVDESGTRARSVTTVGMGGGFGGGAAKPPEPVVFRADHPFLFLLRDVRTGAILFIGRYAVPTETAKAGA